MSEKTVKSQRLEPESGTQLQTTGNTYEPPRLERIGTLLELTLGGFLATPEVVTIRRAGAST